MSEDTIIVEAIGNRKVIRDDMNGDIVFGEMSGYQGDCAAVPVTIARHILADTNKTIRTINLHNKTGAVGGTIESDTLKGKHINFIKAVKKDEKRPKLPVWNDEYNTKKIEAPNDFIEPPKEAAEKQKAIKLPEKEPSAPEEPVEEKQEAEPKAEKTIQLASENDNFQNVLRPQAKKLGLKGYMKLNKPDLVDAINNELTKE